MLRSGDAGSGLAILVSFMAAVLREEALGCQRASERNEPSARKSLKVIRFLLGWAAGYLKR
jgi:hypothetical protein